MIRVKAPITGWREVSRDTALRFARCRYRMMIAVDDKAAYINRILLDGISFTDEELRGKHEQQSHEENY